MTETRPKANVRFGAATLDVTDLQQAKEFWSALLDLEPVHEGGPFVYFKVSEEGQMFGLQQVPESKSGKNRAHPDFAVEDLDAAIETAKSLGGSVIQPPAGEDSPSAIMADPEGNEFCMGVW